ncbi:aminoglycoside phosphotransferase family protein [Acrocarpospora sp. B8E8]|uniref:phosphotransferase family protein n=1 Tax=Acrocarpospora sp. B8E8 TaxID=3153572 RepID=UPI00325F60DE
MMSSPTPVYSAETMTPQWLTDVLRRSVLPPDGAVADLRTEKIGTGQLGECHRLVPTYDGDRGEAPPSLVAKLLSKDPASLEFARGARLHAVEVDFYRDVADRLAVRTPRCYHADVSADERDFVLLLEDIDPAEIQDQLTGTTTACAALAVRQAAALHASSWGRKDLLGLTWQRDPFAFFAKLGANLAALQAMFRARYSDLVEPEHLDIGDRFVEAFPRWLSSLRPRCLWHCDFRLDNMLFRPDDRDPLVVVDWQGIMPGPPVADVSYFLGNGLTESDRRTHERDLLREYHDALRAGGVEGFSWEDCLTTYRAQAFAGFVVTLISAVQVEQTERGEQMFSTMLRRHAYQVLENDSFDALPA